MEFQSFMRIAQAVVMRSVMCDAHGPVHFVFCCCARDECLAVFDKSSLSFFFKIPNFFIFLGRSDNPPFGLLLLSRDSTESWSQKFGFDVEIQLRSPFLLYKSFDIILGKFMGKKCTQSRHQTFRAMLFGPEQLKPILSVLCMKYEFHMCLVFRFFVSLCVYDWLIDWLIQGFMGSHIHWSFDWLVCRQRWSLGHPL